MANRHLSPRHIKSRRTYNVREAAKALGATPATIRGWGKKGLPAVTGIHPAIYRGVDIIDFLQKRQAGRRKPCGPGRMFCLRCKEPKAPAFGEVEFTPDGPLNGVLTGLCPDCAATMKRRTSRAKMEQDAGNLKITIRCADSRLGGTVEPRSNPHFERH